MLILAVYLNIKESLTKFYRSSVACPHPGLSNDDILRQVYSDETVPLILINGKLIFVNVSVAPGLLAETVVRLRLRLPPLPHS